MVLGPQLNKEGVAGQVQRQQEAGQSQPRQAKVKICILFQPIRCPKSEGGYYFFIRIRIKILYFTVKNNISKIEKVGLLCGPFPYRVQYRYGTAVLAELLLRAYTVLYQP